MVNKPLLFLPNEILEKNEAEIILDTVCQERCEEADIVNETTLKVNAKGCESIIGVT